MKQKYKIVTDSGAVLDSDGKTCHFDDVNEAMNLSDVLQAEKLCRTIYTVMTLNNEIVYHPRSVR